MSVFGPDKLRLTTDDLDQAKAAGWRVTEWLGFEGKTFCQLHHERTGRVRTALLIARRSD